MLDPLLALSMTFQQVSKYEFAISLAVLQRPLIVRFTCSEIGEVVGDTQSLYLIIRKSHASNSTDRYTHISSLLFIYNSHITYNLTFPTHRIN